jgi:menaquinone-dependent protoporphyrinogen IX oxidase
MQNAVVIYETLTGNTRKAGERIARELNANGVSSLACPVLEIDYPALAAADVVIIGTWTDGMVLFGQKPGRAGRIWANVPALDRKKTALYCTFAVAPGKTLPKLEAMVRERHGADVVGGYAIRRTSVEQGAETFVDRLLAAAAAPAPKVATER